MKRFLRDSVLVLLSIIIIFSSLPYLIPVSTYKFDKDQKPFPQSKYININGVNIHYRDWNSDKKEVGGKVVFLHGFYGSTYSWNKSVEEVAKRGFYVIAIDIPGFGYSSKELGLDHSLTGRANLIWEVLTKIDSQYIILQDLPWNLVGHSIGAAIVTKIVELKENIGVIILVDPSINNNTDNLYKLFTWYPPVRRWIAVATEYYFFQYNQINRYLESAYNQRPSDEDLKGYLEPIQQNGAAIAASDIFTRGNDERVDLSKVRITTLIVYGEKDSWINKAEIDRLDQEIRFSRVVIIPNAGHVPQETHADEFNKLLLGFIDLPITPIAISE